MHNKLLLGVLPICILALVAYGQDVPENNDSEFRTKRSPQYRSVMDRVGYTQFGQYGGRGKLEQDRVRLEEDRGRLEVDRGRLEVDRIRERLNGRIN